LTDIRANAYFRSNMKAAFTSFLTRWFLRFAVLSVACLSLLPRLQAQPRTDPPIVSYSPGNKPIQGQIPPGFSVSYPLKITSPNNLSAPNTVSLNAIVIRDPVTGVPILPSGVQDATALSYLTFSPSSLTFPKSTQTLTTIVTMAVPGTAVPGAYGFQIRALGWRVDPTLGLSNDGSSINATVTFVQRAVATVTLGGLSATYDGTPKSATATTAPVGLAVTLTYAGNPTAPTNAGSYAVVATISDPSYQGSANGTLVIAKANQTITFAALAPRTVGNAAFTPGATASSGLTVTYASSNSAVAIVSGSLVTIVGAGTATITASQAGNGNYNAAVSVDQTLTVQASSSPTCGTAIVRHAPTLNGNAGVNGSLQVLLPENISLNGNVWISDSLLVPGKPTVKLNGHPTYGSTIDGSGNASPSNYTVTLNGNVVLGHVVRRTDAVAIPTVSAPPAPTGTRDVQLNKSSDSAGNFSTIRDLTLNGNAGQVAVPPDTYRDLTANGDSGFILGVAGATQPAVYNLRGLKLNGGSQVKIVGPVILTVASDVTISGDFGNSAHPEWLSLKIYNGDLTLHGTVSFNGSVLAPAGEVTIDGNGTLTGGVTSDRLTLNGNALVDLCSCGCSGGDRDHDQSHGHDDDHGDSGHGDHENGHDD
jgi:hypothetical protein